MDVEYRENVNVVSKKWYKENKNYWELKFVVVVMKYKIDELFRLKSKVLSKN